MVDAAKQFLGALEGVADPEEKRKIIGREFIRTFEAAEARVLGDAARAAQRRSTFLVQGTLYPDVVESGGGAGTANIKSHHNVGGLPDDLQFELVEPLRTLFKDEVRAGRRAARPAAGDRLAPAVPGPGLGIRIIGEVTRERLDILRQADAIAREELTARRPRPRHLAVPGRAARRRPLGRRPGRRPHLRPPGRAAPGHLRGRDDRRLGPRCPTTCSSGSPPGSPTRCARSTGSRSTSRASRPAPSSGCVPAPGLRSVGGQALHRLRDLRVASWPVARSPATTPARSSSDRFWLSLALPSTRSTASSTPTIARSCFVDVRRRGVVDRPRSGRRSGAVGQPGDRRRAASRVVVHRHPAGEVDRE